MNSPAGTVIDPITTEIIRCALLQAAEDMNTTLIRSAYTPTIYEAKDCAVALLDRDHHVLGQSSGLPIFLGNLEECTRATERMYGRDVWREGDVWVLNDSYIGGTHLNDVTVYAPIHVNGELVGFAASRAHWIDMGSKDPGGSMDSTTIYQEGLRMGPLKIYEGGEPCVLTQDLIARQVRFPQPTLGDMRAQVACALTGARRLAEIVERWGTETLAAARDAIFEQTRQLERAQIADIPDGVYEATGRLDNDGIDLGTPLHVTVRVTIDGEHMVMDVTDCADQATGPVNCGAAQTVAACRVGYKLLVSGEVPLNGGSFDPLEVVTRPGSMLAAVEPAACQYYYSPRPRHRPGGQSPGSGDAGPGRGGFVRRLHDRAVHRPRPAQRKAVRLPGGDGRRLGRLGARRRRDLSDQQRQRVAAGHARGGPRDAVPCAGGAVRGTSRLRGSRPYTGRQRRGPRVPLHRRPEPVPVVGTVGHAGVGAVRRRGRSGASRDSQPRRARGSFAVEGERAAGARR